MNEISIIIPVYNEASNLAQLLTRINETFHSRKEYQVVIVDDHSTDDTSTLITALKHKYPITFVIKKGKKGKAQSLIEGFEYATKPLIAILDGDLQYPPEAIPRMIKKISEGTDIVIARRTYKHINRLRELSSGSFSFIFGTLLHGFDYDIQSGLKVFRKQVLNQINLKPSSGWMFDLEFLIQARNAGFNFSEVNIPFSKRIYGVSKVNIFKTSIEMAIEATKLKIKDTGYIGFNKRNQKAKGQGFVFRGNEYIHHTDLDIHETAFKRFSTQQIRIYTLFGIVLLLLALRNFHAVVVGGVAFTTILYFIDLLYLFFLVYVAIISDPSIAITDHQLLQVEDKELPLYTILCPLYKEWEVLPQFITSINGLDYPKQKLQVILLLEADDTRSIKEIGLMRLPKYFEVVIVPTSRPKTKPKALNYGLKHTKGKFLVIYDAEDSPEPEQLKKAFIAFKKAPKSVGCVQAKLQYYNPEQNILTRLFSIEYLLWFDLVLPGLQAINAPLPLGGTSNHFRTSVINELHGWDAFNVTEDADLGIRLFRKGYRTEIVESFTLEEANSDLSNWIKQRTRWIKGYIQTYFVHIRGNKHSTRDLLNPHVLTFHLIIGFKSFFLLMNPFLWCTTLAYFVFRQQVGPIIESVFPPFIFYLGVFVLLTGNFLYAYMYLIALGKRSQWHLAIYTIIVPLYWLMMSYAAILALIEFIIKPHHWYKTKHGLHLKYMKEKESNPPVTSKAYA